MDRGLVPQGTLSYQARTVLILVIMDRGLVLSTRDFLARVLRVLILVIMDRGLVQRGENNPYLQRLCLNPCYNG